MIGVTDCAEITPWSVYTIDPVEPYFHESAMGVMGDVALPSPTGSVLVGIYDECFGGQLFNSRSCECSEILARSKEQIALEGLGILFSVHGYGYDIHPNGNHQFGQNRSPFSVERYIPFAHILAINGINRVRVLGMDPVKTAAFENQGLDIVAAIDIGDAA